MPSFVVDTILYPVHGAEWNIEEPEISDLHDDDLMFVMLARATNLRILEFGQTWLSTLENDGILEPTKSGRELAWE